MKTKAILFLVLAIAFFEPAFANEKNASGEKIYKEVCFVCHAQGVANAPKLGDKFAWGKLINEGQIIITAHGYVGIRAMPPRGGKERLSVEQFSEALSYMVNKSGGIGPRQINPCLKKSIKKLLIEKIYSKSMVPSNG